MRLSIASLYSPSATFTFVPSVPVSTLLVMQQAQIALGRGAIDRRRANVAERALEGATAIYPAGIVVGDSCPEDLSLLPPTYKPGALRCARAPQPPGRRLESTTGAP